MSKLIHIRKIGSIFLALWLCALSTFAIAGNDDVIPASPTTGLMWNRTGLPAVFPLQVKSPPGQDYFMTLINDETGEDALAAYFIGGAFFKVLVPPGAFRLRFATGDVWQGEDDLFGPGVNTRVFELKKPLTFAVRNLNTKAGHLVNITDVKSGQFVEAAVKDQFICQSMRTEFASRLRPPLGGELVQHTGSRLWVRAWGGRVRYGDERAFSEKLRPAYHHNFYPVPRFIVRSRYCG